MEESILEFIKKVNGAYKGEVLAVGGEFKPLGINRFSSGILSFDLALGGGWPHSRTVLLAGKESTGKTLLAIKACVEIEKYDHVTKKHKDFCEDKFTPGTALYIDAEGDFDIDWARDNGFNAEHHVVGRTEYSEQAIDLITTSIADNVFDLIVVDSIAALTPTEEIENSTENWQMGLNARLMNKGFRRFNAVRNKLSQSGKMGAAVLCINQFRVKIGQMYGDPRVMPGGEGQKFCSSIIVFNKAPDFGDTKEKELGQVIFGGVCQKNKTYIPKLNFSYKMMLKDHETMKKGEVNNVEQMMEFGKKYNLIKTGKTVVFGKFECDTQKEFKARLNGSEVMKRSLWMSIVKAATGQIV